MLDRQAVAKANGAKPLRMARMLAKARALDIPMEPMPIGALNQEQWREETRLVMRERQEFQAQEDLDANDVGEGE